MAESFSISASIPASPTDVYQAWLDSKAHSSFTGGPARIDPRPGGDHSAWDGYIRGRILELEPGRRIVQTWRTTEFPPDSPDSRLEIMLEPHRDGTRLTLNHSDIPEGQGENYRQGWLDYYFEPLKTFFAQA